MRHTTLLACFASATVVALAVAPRFLGPFQYASDVAINAVASIAVIWATKYAADNIAQLRVAQEQLLEPVLYPALRIVHINGQQYVVVELHNLGKSAAVALKIEMRRSIGGDVSVIDTVSSAPSFVRAGEHLEIQISEKNFSFLTDSFEVAVTFDSAVRSRRRLQWNFEKVERKLVPAPASSVVIDQGRKI